MKSLEKIEILLICVDMINGFVKKGAMADNYIEHIIPEHIKLMKTVEESDNGKIAFVRDFHTNESTEFKSYPVHCIEGTEEPNVISELSEFEKNALVYKKNSTSAMHAQKFLEDIDKMKKLKQVIITGCCTDICVLNLAIPLQNYFEQNNREIVISVPKNAVETYDAPNHNRDEYNEIAFKLMGQAGIKLI